jgi:hypothetical protein
MTNTRIWGTLTKTQHKVLCEFLKRFMNISPDIDNNVDSADKKRIARVKKILNGKNSGSDRRLAREMIESLQTCRYITAHEETFLKSIPKDSR